MPPINRSLPITLCWWPRSPAVVVADAECAGDAHPFLVRHQPPRPKPLARNAATLSHQ
jgi:hypothetical protein